MMLFVVTVSMELMQTTAATMKNIISSAFIFN
jgi:hypothetical protein